MFYGLMQMQTKKIIAKNIIHFIIMYKKDIPINYFVNAVAQRNTFVHNLEIAQMQNIKI